LPQVLGIFGLLLPNTGYAQYEPPLRSLNLHYFFTVDATVAATVGSKLKVLFLLGLFIKAPAGDDHCTISAALSVKRQSLQSSVHHHQYEQRHFAKERCEVGEEVESESNALDREMLRLLFQVPLPRLLRGYYSQTAFVLNHANSHCDLD
jgi:hypothetical protein